MAEMEEFDNNQDQRRAEQELMAAFSNLPRQIPIFLFTRPGENDAYVDAAKQALKLFGQLTDKIVLREFSLDHEKAAQMGAESCPTFVFDPDNYDIKWLGAPLGEEGRIFVEALLLLGYQKSGMSEAAAAEILRIDTPRHIKVFVSAGCPYCPQQAVNAIKAAIVNPEMISLEIVDTQANPEMAAQYEAFSVPTTYAEDMLVAQGAQTEELFAASLRQLEQVNVFIPDSQEKEVNCDLVIVGGGPAGLSAGIYAARSGLSAVILEKGVLGGQVALTPTVENYPGIKQVGGKTLVDIMVTHALEYTTIFPGEQVMEITPGDKITVATSRRTFFAKAVLLATGATHRHLGVEGEARLSGKGVSYCATCDGPLFKGKTVLMVGGGNSAATEALHLHNVGVKVTLVHRRDRLRAQESLVKLLKEAGIPIWYDTEITEIYGRYRVEGAKVKNNRTGETRKTDADGVFLAIGYLPQVDLAQKLGLDLSEDGFIAHDGYRTKIPGIYCAGDVAGGFKQIVTAAGQGAEAALTIFEDIIHPYWTQNQA